MMPVITIKQPYALAVVRGIKIFENRSWPLRYRGPLFIHSSTARDSLNDELDLPWFEFEKSELHMGAIIGAVLVVDCLRPKEIRKKYGALFGGARRDSEWCHHYTLPFELKQPIRAVGQYGLWKPKPEAVQFALTELKGSKVWSQHIHNQ